MKKLLTTFALFAVSTSKVESMLCCVSKSTEVKKEKGQNNARSQLQAALKPTFIAAHSTNQDFSNYKSINKKTAVIPLSTAKNVTDFCFNLDGNNIFINLKSNNKVLASFYVPHAEFSEWIGVSEYKGDTKVMLYYPFVSSKRDVSLGHLLEKQYNTNPLAYVTLLFEGSVSIVNLIDCFSNFNTLKEISTTSAPKFKENVSDSFAFDRYRFIINKEITKYSTFEAGSEKSIKLHLATIVECPTIRTSGNDAIYPNAQRIKVLEALAVVSSAEQTKLIQENLNIAINDGTFIANSVVNCDGKGESDCDEEV